MQPGRQPLPAWRRGLLVAGVALWTLASGGACGGGAPPERPRILLIAADGVDWRVALPLVTAGRMPELARLMEQGSYGWLRTEEPSVSPIIWTSIATGKTPRKHGILGFERPDPEGGARLYTNLDRRPKAFWNVLSDYGRGVDVVGWWLTYPVEAIHGVMVAQTNTAGVDEVQAGEAIRKGSLVEGLPGQVHPREREAEVFALRREVLAAFPEEVRGVFGDAIPGGGPELEKLWRPSLWSLQADALYAELGVRLAAEGDFDLLAVYLGGTDVLGHRFWRFYEPSAFEHPPPAEDARRYGAIIPAYYARLDRVIGRLRAAVAGEPTVILISDHGMEALHTRRAFPAAAAAAELVSGGHPTAVPGVFAAAGRGIRRRGAGTAPTLDALPTVGRIYDVAPTLFALLDVPLAEDADGAPLVDVLEPWVLAQGPASPVASHDDTEWFASRQRAGRLEVEESERRQQLRELGYIE